jgi:hypothetical protein
MARYYRLLWYSIAVTSIFASAADNIDARLAARFQQSSELASASPPRWEFGADQRKWIPSTRNDINTELAARFRQSVELANLKWEFPRLSDEQMRLNDFERLMGPNNVRIYQKENKKYYVVRLNFSRLFPNDVRSFHSAIEKSIEDCAKIWNETNWFIWLSLQENNLGNATIAWLGDLLKSEKLKNLRFLDLKSNSLKSNDIEGIKSILKANTHLKVCLDMNPIPFSVKRLLEDENLAARVGSLSW